MPLSLSIYIYIYIYTFTHIYRLGRSFYAYLIKRDNM